MLILSLIAVLCIRIQLAASQNGILTINPHVVPGPGRSMCLSQRTVVDTAIHSINRSVREVLFSTLVLSLDPSLCGNSLWTRVAYLNMSDPSQQCPPSWRLYSANGVRACGRPVTLARTGGCNSQNYTVQQSYQRVCGQIIGYQIGSTNVFHEQQSINEPYVDGVSVTYGEPHRHMWTFAGGISEKNCGCLSNSFLPQYAQWNWNPTSTTTHVCWQ